LAKQFFGHKEEDIMKYLTLPSMESDGIAPEYDATIAIAIITLE
jgi:hypothetical protein